MKSLWVGYFYAGKYVAFSCLLLSVKIYSLNEGAVPLVMKTLLLLVNSP